MNAKEGFRNFEAARRTIQGYEAIHMLRKGQVRWVSGTAVRRQNQFINKVFGLPPETPVATLATGQLYRD